MVIHSNNNVKDLTELLPVQQVVLVLKVVELLASGKQEAQLLLVKALQ